MTGNDSQNSEPTLIGGLSLAEWEKRWEVVPDGFSTPSPKLRHEIGLFAAKDGEEYMYIGKAANMRGDGLSGGLARAYVKNASGDKGKGRAMLKEHRNNLQAHVIKMPRSAENVQILAALKKAMLKLHVPVWNQSEKKIREAREESYRKC